MTDHDIMTQCDLRDGSRQHVAWIPRRFARRGAVLLIDSLPGRWTVTAAYARHRDFSDA